MSTRTSDSRPLVGVLYGRHRDWERFQQAERAEGATVTRSEVFAEDCIFHGVPITRPEAVRGRRWDSWLELGYNRSRAAQESRDIAEICCVR